MFSSTLAFIVLLLPVAFSAPVLPRAARNSFIVKFNDDANVSVANRAQWLQNTLARGGAQISTAQVKSARLGWDEQVFNGLAATLQPKQVRVLQSNPDVEYVIEDTIMRTFEIVTQTNAPWGLSRLSSQGILANQDPLSTDHAYSFDDSGGEGVDIYVVDTGIRTTHQEFGGRASLGAAFGPFQNVDGNGHGTHCAGTAGGATFGVAKQANLIAVKVMADDGSGATSDIISGINFVTQQAAQTGRPSVMSMSIGGGANRALDAAVRNAIAAGVHAVIAAGNEAQDASNVSPGREPAAITVGATTIDDQLASFSNFGDVVDILAPGQDIISAGIQSNTAVSVLSGTSMATPHVSGLVAYLITLEGQRSPDAMRARLQLLGQSNIDVPIANTVNVIANNGALN